MTTELFVLRLCAHLKEIVAEYTAEPIEITPAFTLEDACAAITSEVPLNLIFLDLDLGHNATGSESLEQLQRLRTDLDIYPAPRLRSLNYMVNHICEPYCM